jgi:hypothetical protein
MNSLETKQKLVIYFLGNLKHTFVPSTVFQTKIEPSLEQEYKNCELIREKLQEVTSCECPLKSRSAPPENKKLLLKFFVLGNFRISKTKTLHPTALNPLHPAAI